MSFLQILTAPPPPSKITLSSLSDLKSTSDDAIAPYLTSLPAPYTFTQSHYLSTVRLTLGYISVTIAGILFWVDWKQGWDVTKPYTLPACVAYFVLSSALTYWTWMVERGTVFVGKRKGGQKLTLRSSTRKHDPTYRLHVTYTAPQTGKKWEDKTIEGKFMTWFNMHGYLDKAAFRSWLARNIEVVGLADPSKLQAAEKKFEDVVGETVLGSRDTEATGSQIAEQTTGTKRTKAKKKA